jgi:hypothetical protein
MTDSTPFCPVCELPMVWSDARQRMWCAVYGDHPIVRHPVLRVVSDLDTYRPKRVA